MKKKIKVNKEEEEKPKGFLVYRKGKCAKAPKFIHPTFGAAILEAQRLAKKHEDSSFYIVELCGLVAYNRSKEEFIYR